MVLYSREGRRERCIKRDLSYYDKASVKKDPHTLITVFTKALWKLYNTSKVWSIIITQISCFQVKKTCNLFVRWSLNGIYNVEKNVISHLSYIILND